MNTPPKKLPPNTSGMDHIQKPAWQNTMPRPVAPSIYRPQPAPKVLQTKRASVPNQRAVQAPRSPVAPPVYRPAMKMVQPKAITQLRKAPVARPVYRPEQKRIAQTKMVATASTHQSKRTTASYSTVSPPGRPISHLPSKRTVQLVAVGDQKAMSDGWTLIGDHTGDWAALVRGGLVNKLVPFGHFQANVPAPVNNVKPQYKHLGCVLCVLADYRGTTVTNLLANLDESQRQFAMTTYQGGLHDAGQILAHLSPMGIQDEGFPSYQAFRTTIEEADAVPEWEGALGFGRHIIRASWHGGRLRLWDPQLGVENPAIPTGVPVTLYTFSVLN